MHSGEVIGKDRGEDVVDTGRCPTSTCGNHVYVLESQYERLRETGDQFFCPAGHGQSFTAKPKIDAQKKRLAELETQVERERKRAELKQRKLDEAVRTCPWPMCDGRKLASERGLRQHMVKTHGAPWTSQELGVEEIAQVLNGRDPVELVK